MSQAEDTLAQQAAEAVAERLQLASQAARYEARAETLQGLLKIIAMELRLVLVDDMDMLAESIRAAIKKLQEQNESLESSLHYEEDRHVRASNELDSLHHRLYQAERDAGQLRYERDSTREELEQAQRDHLQYRRRLHG